MSKDSKDIKIKNSDEITVISKPKKKKKRCGICKKKLTLFNEFICKCDGLFCSVHMYPYEHECKIDHKKNHIDRLEKENPKVAPDKIKDRIE